MKVRVAITASQAAAAAAALEPFVRTWRRFDCADQNCGRPHPYPGEPWGTDHLVGDTWECRCEIECVEGIGRVLNDLAVNDSPFGWLTARGNLVLISVAGDSPTGLAATFNGRRHALSNSGNGVGAVFRALGGTAWAETAEVLELKSLSAAPWHQWGVQPRPAAVLSAAARIGE